jgi:hypothetical protein
MRPFGLLKIGSIIKLVLPNTLVKFGIHLTKIHYTTLPQTFATTLPLWGQLPANHLGCSRRSLVGSSYPRGVEAFQPAQNLTGQTDIDGYFDTPTITTGFDANQSQTDYIRDWWKVNKVEFNCMAKVAQDYLAIPAAEVDICHGARSGDRNLQR